MQIGKKLYDLRMAKNLTKEKLAKEIGVSKTAYGKWENNLSKPRFSNITLLCDFYQISKDNLMSEEKYISKNNSGMGNDSKVISSQNSTINHTLPKEIIESFLNSHKIITDLMQMQTELFEKFLKIKS